MRDKKALAIKALVLFIAVFVFYWAAKADDSHWYSKNLFEVTSGGGKKYQMAIITKTNDKDTCEQILNAKGMDVGRWKNIGNDCSSGETSDEAFVSIFDNKEVATIYVSFVDNYGYPTRINFIEAPKEFANPIAENLAQSLKEQGIENAQVIYPQD
ncbi:MAG: hypothetical protein JW734_03090 [Candidatus Omnitrophica bacterium]|nr:hypothetical protein [Candidatus Omnitrophota bacterium]